jgi:hypothetical protein
MVAYTNAANAIDVNQVIGFAIIGAISVVMVKKGDGEVYVERWHK